MPKLEGTTLGRYRLKRLLGRGGMAEVYLAADEHLHRDVAVKVVHLSREEDLARFHKEAELLGPLVHEHILPVFDYGEQDYWHYLVMPYISNGTMEQRLKDRGPFSQESAGRLLEQIASALQYAHDRGILHRDIKPSNILLRDDTYAYIADFGIARALNEESELTQAGMIIGTPEYMAPELLEHPASTSSDVYALGVLLYDMLTGQVPFTGPTGLAVLQKQANAAPLPLSQINPAISLPVERVVLRALEKDPQRRFRSPQALANAYRKALQQSRNVAAVPQRFPLETDFFTDTTREIMPPPRQPAPVPPRKRGPGAFIVVAIAIVGLLILLTAAFLLNEVEKRPLSQTPVTPTSTASTPTPTPTPSPTASDTSCSVNDNANILDQTQVCQAAQALPYPVSISTTNTSSQGDGDANQQPQSAEMDPKTILISISVDTSHAQPRAHIKITGGSDVPLTDHQYHQAMDVFNHTAHSGDFTQATVDAIQALKAGQD